MSHAVTVPKITLTVGRLSSSPFVLLHRISKVIQFEDQTKFNSEDDYNTLFYLFYDSNQIENRISEESRRVLNAISRDNSIFTDHKVRIKDTPKLPYDVRCKTWSKAYNHAFIDPVSGEPRRPLNNYVYEDHQREMIKNTRLPPGERPPLPYPDIETEASRSVQVGTWDAVFENYRKIVGSNVDVDRWKKDRQISTENLVSCLVSNVAIDDYFIWLWMCSLSSEQDEPRKSLFGRSVVIEINLDNTPAGRRWVIVEEILNPVPLLMEAKKTPPDNTPLVTKKPKLREKAIKKPVRVAVPVAPKPSSSIQKPKPVPVVPKPVPVVYPQPQMMAPVPQPNPTQTINIHYNNIDPLVAAVAKRLRIHNIDEGVQTENSSVPLAMKEPAEDYVSADEGNSKGIQTYSSTSIGVSTDNPYVSSLAFSPQSNSLPKHDSLPVINFGSEAVEQPKPEIKRSASYEDVMHSIPYLDDDSDDFDYSVTPIVNHAVSSHEPVFIPKMRYAQEPDFKAPSPPPPQMSPPLNAEGFVIPIDSSNRGRVFSMPVRENNGTYMQGRHAGNYNEFEDANYDYEHSGTLKLSNMGSDNGSNNNMNGPPGAPGNRRRPAGHSRSRSMAFGPLPPPVFSISAGNRETSKTLLAAQGRGPNDQGQPLDRGMFDRSSSDVSEVGNNPPVNNNMFRLNPLDPSGPNDSGPYGTARSLDPRDSKPRPAGANGNPRNSSRDSRVPRGFQGNDIQRPFPKHAQFGGNRSENNLSRSMDSFGKPNSRFGKPAGHSGGRGAQIPFLDDMLLDLGPMRGGAGAARNKALLGPVNHKPPQHQKHKSQPYAHSSSSLHNFGLPKKYNYSSTDFDIDYGSDTGYRYDTHEKAKATPDSMLNITRPPMRSRPSGDASNQNPNSRAPRSNLNSSNGNIMLPPEPLFHGTRANSNPSQGAPLPDFNQPSQLKNINDTGDNFNTVAASMVNSPQHRANSVSASFFSKSTSTISEDMVPNSSFPHEFGAPLGEHSHHNQHDHGNNNSTHRRQALSMVQESSRNSQHSDGTVQKDGVYGNNSPISNGSFGNAPGSPFSTASSSQKTPGLVQAGNSQSSVSEHGILGGSTLSINSLAPPTSMDINRAFKNSQSQLSAVEESRNSLPPTDLKNVVGAESNDEPLLLPVSNPANDFNTEQCSNSNQQYSNSQPMGRSEEIMKNINPLRILKRNASKRKSRHSTGGAGDFLSNLPWKRDENQRNSVASHKQSASFGGSSSSGGQGLLLEPTQTTAPKNNENVDSLRGTTELVPVHSMDGSDSDADDESFDHLEQPPAGLRGRGASYELGGFDDYNSGGTSKYPVTSMYDTKEKVKLMKQQQKLEKKMRQKRESRIARDGDPFSSHQEPFTEQSTSEYGHRYRESGGDYGEYEEEHNHEPKVSKFSIQGMLSMSKNKKKK